MNSTKSFHATNFGTWKPKALFTVGSDQFCWQVTNKTLVPNPSSFIKLWREAKIMKYPLSQSSLQLVVPIWQFWPMKHKQTFPESLRESSYFLDGRRRPSGATIPLFPAMDRDPGAEMAILQPWLKSQESAEWRPRSGWVTEGRSTALYPLCFLSWTLLKSFIFVYYLQLSHC